MDRITKGYLDNFATSQEIPQNTDESTLFELFSCYCALSKEYPESFELSDITVGGGGDTGLDGIAILANGTIVNTVEEIDDLIEQNNSISELKFVFVQAKTSPSFDGGEISTFGFGVCDIFKEQPQLVQNDDVKRRLKLYRIY